MLAVQGDASHLHDIDRGNCNTKPKLQDAAKYSRSICRVVEGMCDICLLKVVMMLFLLIEYVLQHGTCWTFNLMLHGSHHQCNRCHAPCTLHRYASASAMVRRGAHIGPESGWE